MESKKTGEMQDRTKGGMGYMTLIIFKQEFPQGTLEDFIRFTKTLNPRSVWAEYHKK